MTEAFQVVEPGLLTTIQDLGRPHVVPSGVPAGGAMDRFAHSAANLLVGNDRGAATLECTVRGTRLKAMRRCVVAVTGADLEPQVHGTPAPTWTAFAMDEGDQLSFGRRRLGTRAYIAVAGGFLGDRWLGSMSTNLMTARGGMHGRALIAGDVLAAGESMVSDETGRTLEEPLRPRYADHTLHAVAGPHANRLAPDSRSALFGARFAVSPNSNRMGYRLDGPTLDAPGEELLSIALVAGAVQLPGGKPILLMADHQTAGGYPVVAVVVSASMPVAAQLAPGDEMIFAETTLESALEMRAGQLAALESLTS